ncbi:MAG: VWA domain-containing protein [Planctomycetes bacterium]|nr:VWA domain-containing protein [Planctomycetota bacterium]
MFPSFLNPSALLFLGLLAPLILLYMLKIQRHNRIVPSTALWRNAVNDLEANMPFQKLRRNIILILQIIFIILLTVALTQPVIKATVSEPHYYAVIIDASASMQAKEASGKTRFSIAVDSAKELINNIGEGGQACIIEAGVAPRIVHSFSADKKLLANSLDGLYPHCTSSDLKEAFSVASTLLEKKPKKTTCIITDGNDAGINNLPATDEEVRYICVAETSDNLAITNISVEFSYTEEWYEQNRNVLMEGVEIPVPYDIFVQADNFSAEHRQFYLTLRAPWNNEIVDSKEVSLGPGEHSGHIFNAELLPGIYNISLEEKDALDIDNTAYLDFEQPPFVKVLIAGEDDALLKKVLQAKKGCVVSSAKSPQAGYAEKYDLVIFVDSKPEKEFPGLNSIIINPPDPKESGLSEEEFQVSNITAVDREHPVMKFVDLTDVHILKTRLVTGRPEMKGLVSVNDSKLVGINEDEGLRILIPFNIYDSDWPLRSSFPVFFHNVVDRVREKHCLQFFTTVGNEIKLPSAKQFIHIVSPSGRSAQVGEALLDEPGIHTLEGNAGLIKRHPANFFNARESNIAPVVKEIKLGARVIRNSPGTSGKTNREIWQFIVLIALGLTSVEWYLYHRRE